jgi:hypothetical protein
VRSEHSTLFEQSLANPGVWRRRETHRAGPPTPWLCGSAKGYVAPPGLGRAALYAARASEKLPILGTYRKKRNLLTRQPILTKIRGDGIAVLDSFWTNWGLVQSCEVQRNTSRMAHAGNYRDNCLLRKQLRRLMRRRVAKKVLPWFEPCPNVPISEQRES